MILVVGDGPRDSVSLPKIVLHLIGKQVEFVFRDIHTINHLRSGRGYSRKVMYLTRLAKKDGNCALVVVADKDCSNGDRLKEMKNGRDEDRTKQPAFPTALGEADPHFDVWLLDDAHAVATAFGVEASSVPNVRKCNSPKQKLNELMPATSPDFQSSNYLGQIAECFQYDRCQHVKETGLYHFAEEVRGELSKVFS